jgi:hypothetical protein
VTTQARATFTITFEQSGRAPKNPRTSPARTPRVARLLALAHDIERRIRDGELADLAHAARSLGLTRARVTQIANLTLLAPAIQEEILTMPPVTAGRDLVTERTLRRILAEPVWYEQAELWRPLASAADPDHGCRIRG